MLVTIAVGLALITFGLALRHDPVDAPLVRLLNDTHVGAWGLAADLVYTALEPVIAIVLTVLVTVAVAVASRSTRIAAAFAGTVALTWLPIAAMKLVVARPRPDVTGFAHAFSPSQVDGSFPSGHTAFVAALAIAFWFLLHGTRWSLLVVILGTVATVTVGVAVVSDGLHYPTDVAASVLWALGMAPTARWAMSYALSTQWFKRSER